MAGIIASDGAVSSKLGNLPNLIGSHLTERRALYLVILRDGKGQAQLNSRIRSLKYSANYFDSAKFILYNL
jgi:hypothetical protein